MAKKKRADEDLIKVLEILGQSPETIEEFQKSKVSKKKKEKPFDHRSLDPMEVLELAERNSPNVTINLLAILNDTGCNSESRAYAAWGLGKLKATQASGDLLFAVNDPDPNVREKAIWALGNIGNTRAYPHLIRVLKEPQEELEIKWTAALALMSLGYTREVEPLITSLKSRLAAKMRKP